MLSFDVSIYYSIGLFLKVGLLLFNSSAFIRPRLWRFTLFAAALLFVSGIHLFLGDPEGSGAAVISAFLVSLLCTLILIYDENCVFYLRTMSISIFIGAILYIAFVKLGRIDDVWGRWTYFGNSQPNLGGEIIYTGVLATALGKPKLSALNLAIFASSIYAIMLLQARSALIASIFVIIYLAYLEFLRQNDLHIRIIIISGLVVILMYCLLLTDEGVSAFSSALLVDDVHRGAGTGFVGRADAWAYAMQSFYESPIIGGGFGFYHSEPGADWPPHPHSLWLHMLSEMGFIGLVSLVAIFLSVKSAWRENKRLMFFLASSLVMTVFNDRFINMNPYPFLIFVVLFWPRSVWSKLSN
jgi:O-Antigen ligase